MIFKNHQNKFSFNKSLTLNDMNIKEVDEIKFLGVVIDKHSSWSSHANKLLRYLRPAAGLLYCLSNFVPKKVFNIVVLFSHTL